VLTIVSASTKAINVSTLSKEWMSLSYAIAEKRKGTLRHYFGTFNKNN
jgi:hypothetical protein